jgi:hypothetical protein
LDNYQDPVEWFFRNYPDGLHLMGGRTDSDSAYQKKMFLKYPVAPGESWETERLVYDFLDEQFHVLDTVTYTCTDTNAVFAAKAGAMSCIVYYHKMDSPEPDVQASYAIYDYYHPQVGLVGRISYAVIPSRGRFPRFYLTLTSTNVP